MNDWTYDIKGPGPAGWYAVLICYDEAEGVFPSAAYWSGEAWDRKAVIGFAGPFAIEADAEQWASDHDPERPYKAARVQI